MSISGISEGETGWCIVHEHTATPFQMDIARGRRLTLRPDGGNILADRSRGPGTNAISHCKAIGRR